MTNVPKQFSGRVQATINDREFMVVARNVILLLVALTEDTSTSLDKSERGGLAEYMIHLWYSAFVPVAVLARVNTRVGPLIEDVCHRIARTAANSLQEQTWRFASGNSLRLILRKEEWFCLPDYLHVPEGLTQEEASKIRTATTLAPERADYRDRWCFKDESPFVRVAKQRFRDDGLLLPFGHPRLGFSVPNP